MPLAACFTGRCPGWMILLDMPASMTVFISLSLLLSVIHPTWFDFHLFAVDAGLFLGWGEDERSLRNHVDWKYPT